MDEQGRLERLRAICLSLPETTERLSHGEPTWFVRDKKSFVTFSNHHHGGEFGFWCAAPFGAQDAMISTAPDRYFRPPYVGHRGWVGVRLDLPEMDWDEVESVVREAYRTIAPAKLAALM
ncbi:MAG: MmcQ/YjbR family DNA-binding protein [Dehalococcoidia bacterium]